MDEEKDPQALYKQHVRAWLRDRGLSMKWLASWLGKSEGTVKNWFYGGNPIIEENVDSIDALQVNYHKDNRYHFINPDFDPSPKAYNIPKKQFYIAVVDEADASLISYALNAEIENVFYNSSLDTIINKNYVSIITNILTNKTRELLLQEKEKCKKKNIMEYFCDRSLYKKTLKSYPYRSAECSVSDKRAGIMLQGNDKESGMESCGSSFCHFSG